MNQLKTVLLIDDDEVTNYLNIRIVTHLNLSNKIEIRRNGHEALEYLIECDKLGLPGPELILLDYVMPYMDGGQFLEEYSKLDYGKAKIVFLSATQHRNTDELCKRHRIEHFILKPLTPNKLIEAVN